MYSVPGGDIKKLAIQQRFELLDPAKLSEPLRSDVHDAIRMFSAISSDRAAQTKPGHQVSFGFVDDPEFNAFACHLDGDIIGINLGVLVSLRDFYSRLLPRLSDFVLFPEYLRQDAVVWMYKRSLIWVFCHELCHVWNGHLEYVNQKTNLRLISELHMASASGLTGIDLQTIEMDADSNAVAIVMANSMNFDQQGSLNEQNLIFPEFEGKYGHGASRAALAGIAINHVFKFFEEDYPPDIDVMLLGHPPAVYRQNLARSVVLEVLKQRFGWSSDTAVEVLRAAVVKAEVMWADVNNLPKPDADLIIKNAADSFAFGKKLLANWHNIRPVLEKYKRGGNLPPVQDWALR